MLVTGNYFELLGARPSLGRLLRPSDAAARGGAPVVVLSHNAWRSRYGSDPAIVGQRIPLGRQRFEVVGVTEPQAYLSGQELVSFWAPLTMAGAFPGIDPWVERDARSLVVVGRLRPGVTAAAMRAWFDVWLRQRIPPPSDSTPAAVRVDSLATRIILEGGNAEPGSCSSWWCSGWCHWWSASANRHQPDAGRARWHGSRKLPCARACASRWRVAAPVDRGGAWWLAVPAAAAGLVPSS
jgi:hypothetical protein